MIQHLYYETLIPFLKRLKKKKKNWTQKHITSTKN